MVRRQTQISLNSAVQIDETYVKGKALNRTKKERRKIANGEREDKAGIVLGMVNDESIVMKVVPDTEMDTLKPVITENITDNEALIVTDGFTSYNGLELIYKGRIVINHTLGEYKVGDYHTNSIEGAFGLFKRIIFGTYHFVTIKHLQRYCTLFAYRFNTRKLREFERFDKTFDHTKARLRYTQLIAPLTQENRCTIKITVSYKLVT